MKIIEGTKTFGFFSVNGGKNYNLHKNAPYYLLNQKLMP